MAETLVIKGELAELARVADWVDAIGQRLALPQATLFAINLCFEEALSNTILYGLVGEVGHDDGVSITLEREDDAIVATIDDHGIAFDPLAAAAPVELTTVEDAPIGGRGIHLIRHFTTDLAYERWNGMNRLTLRFACP